MNGKNVYFSNNTGRIINAVVPEHFKMASDKTSNGYKYVNLLYTIEVDLLYDYLDDARYSNSLEYFDYGTDYDYFEVTLNENVISDTVYGDNIPIKITTQQEFNDGFPTRFNIESIIPVSGVSYGALGIEYVRKTAEGSGVLLINTDVDASEIFPSGYQTISINIDPVGRGVYGSPLSGYNFLVREQSYDVAGNDEIIVPPTRQELLQLYPEQKKIWAQSGVSEFSYNYWVDHYTPNNGAVWNDTLKTWEARGYSEDYYLDMNNNKVYYRTFLNNPHGTGNYNETYMPLKYVPISGTFKLYDLDILQSGQLVNIDASGTTLYIHSGMYDFSQFDDRDEWFSPYKGYDENVPHEFIPNGYKELNPTGVLPAIPYQEVSWELQHEGARVGDDFTWQDDDTEPITNMLKIKNGQSRYIAEYFYKIANKIGYLTTLDSTKYIRYGNGNYTFSIQDITNNRQEFDVSLSKDPTDRKAACFHGLLVRPFSTIDQLNVTFDVASDPLDLQDSSINIYARAPKVGTSYSEIKPIIHDKRTYMFNKHWGDVDLSGVVDLHQATNDIVSSVPYGTYKGVSLIHVDTSENTYYETIGQYSGYMDLITETSTNSNRYVKMGFKVTKRVGDVGEQMLAMSCNSSGEFWALDLLPNGRFRVRDNLNTLISYDGIFEEGDNFERELILERDTDYDYGPGLYPYRLYTRSTDTNQRVADSRKDIFTQHGFDLSVNANDPSGIVGDVYDFTKLFYNTCTDIEYVQIYEESREFVDGQ